MVQDVLFKLLTRDILKCCAILDIETERELETSTTCGKKTLSILCFKKSD